MLAGVLAGVITDPGRRTIGAWGVRIVVFAAAIGCRGLATWWQSRLAHRAGAQVVAELEQAVLVTGSGLAPRELDSRRTELAVVVGSALSGLRAYLTGYLPALVLAVLVPPIVLAVIAVHDPASGVIILVTLPLIPVFMVLIGLMTQGRSAATLAAATRLSDQLLDLFAGMPTLRALGRETAGHAADSGVPAVGVAAGEVGEDGADSGVSAAPGAGRETVGRAADSGVSAGRVAGGGDGERAPDSEMSAVCVVGGGIAGCARDSGVSASRVTGRGIAGCEAGSGVAAVCVGSGGIAGSAADPGMSAGREAAGGAVDSAVATARRPGREVIRAAEDSGPTMSGRVRALGENLHTRTMAALRVAFLSSMVLEMLATLCVALVAVSIGMRLVFGHMGLYAGLLGLILAPEVYLPLRAVGERFHAAQDGMAAAEKAFAVLESNDRVADVVGARTITDFRGVIEIRELCVRARDGFAPAGLSATLRPGAITVLAGPNGCGKSTVLQSVLGLIRPDCGQVAVEGIPVPELDPESWWSRVAWLPQRPVLLPGTLCENLELFGTALDLDRLESASAATGFDAVLAELPERWDTLVGSGGLGLSLGQRQRLALTRVLAADRPILLLDEPTAHLDDDSAAMVLSALTARARAGATVVVVAHRPDLIALADYVVEVCAAQDDSRAARTTAEARADLPIDIADYVVEVRAGQDDSRAVLATAEACADLPSAVPERGTGRGAGGSR